MNYRQAVLSLTVSAFVIINLTACTERPQIGVPPIADIHAATEAKPRPTSDILTDPAADARYNAAVEGWGERVRAAGVRVCRFYQRVGVKVECGS